MIFSCIFLELLGSQTENRKPKPRREKERERKRPGRVRVCWDDESEEAEAKWREPTKIGERKTLESSLSKTRRRFESLCVKNGVV